MKKYKVVVFDLDGVLIDVESSWLYFHKTFGTVGPLRDRAQKAFLARKFTYQDWVDHDIGLWQRRGVTKKEMIAAIKRLRLIKGAAETLQTLKRRGYKLGILSGGMDFILSTLLPEAWRAVDYIYLNHVIFDEQGHLVRGIAPAFRDAEKADGLRLIAKQERVPLTRVAFVADHFNDVEAAKVAGLSIAFDSKSEALDRVADVHIKKKDLREVLLYFP